MSQATLKATLNNLTWPDDFLDHLRAIGILYNHGFTTNEAVWGFYREVGRKESYSYKELFMWIYLTKSEAIEPQTKKQG